MQVTLEKQPPSFSNMADTAIDEVFFYVHNVHPSAAKTLAIMGGLKIVLDDIRSHLVNNEIHCNFTCDFMVHAAHHHRRSQALRFGMTFMIQQVHRTRCFHSQVAKAILKLQTDKSVSS